MAPDVSEQGDGAGSCGAAARSHGDVTAERKKKDLDAVRRGRCAGVLLMHKTRAQVFVYLSARLGCLAAP